MREIRITIEEKDFERLEKQKKKMSWREFILESAKKWKT